MNCYYRNLIEGHDTHPIDIERALENDYSKDRANATTGWSQGASLSFSVGSMKEA